MLVDHAAVNVKKFVAGILMAALLVAAVLVARHLSLTQGWCSACKGVFVLVFPPPSDYYEPLAVVSTRATGGTQEGRLSFRPRYHGMHAIEVYPADRSAFQSVSFKVKCIGGREQVSEGILVDRIFSKRGRGFLVRTFLVPQDFSRSAEVTCNVSFEGRNLDTAVVVAEKWSDM